MTMVATPSTHINYDTCSQLFIVWDETSCELGRTASYKDAVRVLSAYSDYLTTGDKSLHGSVKHLLMGSDTSPADDFRSDNDYEHAWRRVIEALDKHHPQWIDGNGSSLDKVLKFIEGEKAC